MEFSFEIKLFALLHCLIDFSIFAVIHQRCQKLKLMRRFRDLLLFSSEAAGVASFSFLPATKKVTKNASNY